MAKIHSFFGNTEEAVDMRCGSCGLDSRCKNPRIGYVGKGEKEILVVIDSIDDQANRSGNLADSQQYKFLTTEFRKNGINLYKDCWVTSCVKCNLGGERPTKKEMLKCNYRLMDEIKELHPKHIWTFGNIALGAITDKYYSGIQDTAMHGDIVPIHEFGTWLTPFFAIFMIQAKKKDPNFQAVFSRDLKKAIVFQKKGKELISYNYTDPKNITFLLDADAVIEKIDELIELGGYQAFDYETTGLKPQADGHKIPTMAIATKDHCWAFPVDYQEYWSDEDWENITEALQDYLSSKNISHVAHNKNFENVWGSCILESSKYVNFCTQATQHVLDHRKGTKSLKYQIFRRWGLHSYEKNASRYISSSGGANSFNKMDEMPLPEQLLYVGIDAFCTMQLFLAQRKELKGRMTEADKLWQTSVNTMSYIQETGIRVDTDYYESTEKELTETIIGLEKSIRNNEDVKAFAKKFRRQFNETSPDDLKDLLFKQMGIESIKETDGGGQAVDAEVLKKLDLPLTNYILDLRKYLKLRDTYLAQYKREEVDGFLHPFFGLTVAVSYRSQCIAGDGKVLVCRNFESDPEGVAIKDIKVGDLVYCFDDKLNPQIQKVLWQGKTGHREVVRVHYQRTGKKGYFDCTPEHKIRLIDGSYVEAQNLFKERRKKQTPQSPNVHALACSRTGDFLNFSGHLKHGHGIKEHRFIYQQLIGELKEENPVHHKNGNHFDHRPENLQQLTISEHSKIHNAGKSYSKETCEKIAKNSKQAWKDGKHTITSVEFLNEKMDVYDIRVEKYHNFFVNEICVHNSNDPNFQNVPKRDKESKKLIRRGIVPRKGNMLAEIDFSGMEVSTSATYHKDPNFIKYLVTPGTDMHRDNGSDIWQLPNEEITSEIRFFIKNGWTFPQFYGDYFGSCAPNLWETSLDLKIKSGITLREHMRELKIYSVDEFTEHCKTAEDIMWNKRFKVYTAWKKQINDFYLQNGYVETHLGFRFTGYMDKKQTANFPIQGTAFHLLLVCLNTLHERKIKYGWKSNIIGQVHDSGILDLVPEEALEILSEFKHIAEVELAQMFSFINVPYKIDMELSEINGNFAELTEHKIVNGIFVKVED